MRHKMQNLSSCGEDNSEVNAQESYQRLATTAGSALLAGGVALAERSAGGYCALAWGVTVAGVVVTFICLNARGAFAGRTDARHRR